MENNQKKLSNYHQKPEFKVHTIGSTLPISAVDAEIAVLGGMMMTNKAIPKVINLLDEKCFFYEKHISIYKAIIALYNNNVKIDILTLKEELKRIDKYEDIGGDKYLLEINRRTPSSANVEQHAIIVLDKYYRRTLIKYSEKAIERASDETMNIIETIPKVEEAIKKIINLTNSKNSKDDANEYHDYLIKIKSGEIKFIPTGLRGLDNVINGFVNGNFVVVGARPGVGKTALGVTISTNIAYKLKLPTLFISIEMTKNELMNRIISQKTLIPIEQIKTNNLTTEEEQKINNALYEHSISKYFIEDSISDIDRIIQVIRMWVIRENIKIVFIDNFQHLTTSEKFKDDKNTYSYYSSQLREIAKELQIVIVSLNQLNRNLESRKKQKQPIKSDLRDSGGLEQDAHIIIFIDRPEADFRKTFDNGELAEGLANIIVAKNRDGRTGIFKMEYYAPCAKFQNYDPLLTASSLEPPRGFYHNPQEPFEGDDDAPKF